MSETETIELDHRLDGPDQPSERPARKSAMPRRRSFTTETASRKSTPFAESARPLALRLSRFPPMR